MNDGMKSTGTVALVLGGVGTAFALAACCAVPALLAAIGVSAAWLTPIVSASQPHAEVLTGVSAIALLGSVGVVARAPQHCDASATCARPWFRSLILIGAVAGAALLIASKLYA